MDTMSSLSSSQMEFNYLFQLFSIWGNLSLRFLASGETRNEGVRNKRLKGLREPRMSRGVKWVGMGEHN